MFGGDTAAASSLGRDVHVDAATRNADHPPARAATWARRVNISFGVEGTYQQARRSVTSRLSHRFVIIESISCTPRGSVNADGTEDDSARGDGAPRTGCDGLDELKTGCVAGPIAGFAI